MRKFGSFLGYKFGIAALTMLAACSAKIDGGDTPFNNPPPGPKPTDFSKPAIPGPQVEGEWTSSCLRSSGGGTRLVQIQFRQNLFTYTSTEFSDRSCQTLSLSRPPLKHDGSFQFSAKNAGEVFDIDYRYVENKVTYSMDGQKIKLDGDRLFISEFVWSSNIEVDLTMPLRRTQSPSPPPPPPTPTPSPTPAPTCADFKGLYNEPGYGYTKLEQNNCDSLVWQASDSSGNSNGLRTTYVMDGKLRNYNGRDMKVYYVQNSFAMDFTDSRTGNDVQINFELVRVSSACGESFGANRLILLRTGKTNGSSDSEWCRFWNKIN